MYKKGLTAGYLFSSINFRHNLIPLNSKLKHIPIKLEATVIKRKKRKETSPTYTCLREGTPVRYGTHSSWPRRLNGDSLIHLQLSPKATR